MACPDRRVKGWAEPMEDSDSLKGHGALNRLHAPVGLKGNLSAAVGLKQAQRGGHGHAYGCQGGQAVRAVTLVHGVSMELVRGSPSGENKGEPGRCM